MITVGGETNADLRDLWALDLDEYKWYKPDVQGFESFTPKRFHTLTTLPNNKVISFGGCFGEYIHLNEMHIFDLSDFVESPSDFNKLVICTKVDLVENVPSTRWGHSASAYKDNLYLVGGRNE